MHRGIPACANIIRSRRNKIRSHPHPHRGRKTHARGRVTKNRIKPSAGWWYQAPPPPLRIFPLPDNTPTLIALGLARSLPVSQAVSLSGGSLYVFRLPRYVHIVETPLDGKCADRNFRTPSLVPVSLHSDTGKMTLPLVSWLSGPSTQ